ncbi:hypothetical protein D9M70_561420 [compost metagenome]
MFQLKRVLQAAFVSVAMAVLATGAQAEGLADLAAGIDKTDIVAGLIAIALLIGGALGARKGIRMVLSLIK